MAKAEMKEVREFFETGAKKVTAADLMGLKRVAGPGGQELPDYDQVAEGIGDGSMTYELTPEQKANINAQRADAGWAPLP